MPANLPPLREELVLHQGPANWDGSPAWTLEDPLRGRFFRLGWLEMALLSRWSLGDRQRLIAEVNQRQPQQIDEQDVENFCGFLQQHALLRSSGEESVRQFARQTQQGKAVCTTICSSVSRCFIPIAACSGCCRGWRGFTGVPSGWRP